MKCCLGCSIPKRWFLPTVYFLYPMPSCDNMWLNNLLYGQAFCCKHGAECLSVWAAVESAKLSADQKASLVSAGTVLLMSHCPALQSILHYRTKFQATNAQLCLSCSNYHKQRDEKQPFLICMCLVCKHFCTFPCVRTFVSGNRSLCVIACVRCLEQDLGQKRHSKHERIIFWLVSCLVMIRV